jgi:single-strand DNA-binding protein
MSYSSINRVVLVGNLTRDPELRELPSGRSVCNMRIACNGLRRDTEGEYRERPLFFDVAAFGAQAENVARFMRKGSRVAIDGRLEWREWETAERSAAREDIVGATGSEPVGQQKRQAVSVVAETVQFLDRPTTRAEGDQSGETPASGSHPPFDQQGEPGVEDGERELVGAGAGEIDLVF